MEIANWNVEWFGHASNGPTNETLQQKNVAAVIAKSQIDLWGLCEISNATAWDTLLGRLPEYGGVISTWSQEQKTALIYKKSQFRFLYQKHPLGVYEQEFASGRLPLEVGLEMNLNGQKDTLYVFVVHLKANTGSTTQKADAWDRRKRSSEALKEYLDAWDKSKKCVILGDWNDDVDKSIFSNYATPFSALVGDTAHYYFPSKELSASGGKSTTSYNDMIDHQCATKALVAGYLATSAKVFPLHNYITSYATNTSDHYPVYSFYRFAARNTSALVNPEMSQIKPFIANGKVCFSDGLEHPYTWFDLSGRKLESVQQGLYILQFEVNGIPVTRKIFIEP